MTRRFGFAAVLSLFLAIVSSVGVAAAAPTSTLTGEVLAAIASPGQTNVRIFAQCNPDGSGRVFWAARGVATPPYAGTFYEAGTAIVGPLQPTGLSVVTSLDAIFIIDSSAGFVTGTKTLQVSTSGVCDRENVFENFRLTDVQAVTNYDAIIIPPSGGAYHDSGQARTRVFKTEKIDPTRSAPGVQDSLFFEGFTSLQPATTPVGGGDSDGGD